MNMHKLHYKRRIRATFKDLHPTKRSEADVRMFASILGWIGLPLKTSSTVTYSYPFPG